MRIRSALPADCRAIAQLHAASWRSAYAGALSAEFLASDIMADRNVLWRARLTTPSAGQYVVVAETDGALAGFACAYLDEDREWGSLLDNLHVRQDAHRKGIGSALLKAVAAECSSLASQAGLYLWVLQDNTAAQRFYARHGAQNVGADMWNAPGGTRVLRFRLAWPPKGLPAAP